MLTEHELKDNLIDQAKLFDFYYAKRDWGRAKQLYNRAIEIATFMKLDKEFCRTLFGENGERGTYIMWGLFDQEKVLYVDYKCCIESNRGYQDIAARKMGLDPEYYSDDGFCAQCKKRDLTFGL